MRMPMHTPAAMRQLADLRQQPARVERIRLRIIGGRGAEARRRHGADRQRQGRHRRRDARREGAAAGGAGGVGVGWR